MSGPLNLTVVTVILISAFFTHSHAQWPRHPLAPVDEAKYIVLDNDESALVPNHEKAIEISKTIVEIRKKFKEVAKVRNQGNWPLGRVLVSNFNQELKEKIDQSKFGPITEFKMPNLMQSNEAELYFNQPYHPDRLSAELNKLFDAGAKSIWHDRDKVPDIGRIEYDAGKNEYNFKEGMYNCGPSCSWIQEFHFKVDPSSNEITLDSASAVDAPKMRDY